MNNDTLTLVGAFGGAFLGVLGGLFGTVASIRSTSGPRERAYTIRASVLGWMAAIVFVAAVLFTPILYQPLLWLPYMAALPYAVRAWNRKQARIREEESRVD
jgi:hypothetical protein